MRDLSKLLFGVAMFLPVTCYGQGKCPWMNEATVRGILGGAVTLKTNLSDHGGGACEFSERHGATLHQLRIAVEVMTDIPKQFPSYLSQCPANSTPLRAIGNEAVMCSVQDKKRYAETAVGRVRDQAFVVSVSSSVQDDPSLTLPMRREKTQLAAEEVAGILF